jgi:hypothetical protein
VQTQEIPPVTSGAAVSDTTHLIETIEPYTTYTYTYTLLPSVEGSIKGFRAVGEYLPSELKQHATYIFSTDTKDIQILNRDTYQSITARQSWRYTAYWIAGAAAIALPVLYYVYLSYQRTNRPVVVKK